MLSGAISVQEVQQAISQLATFKAPGIDGFTAEFYSKFGHLLALPLCQMFLDMANGCPIPVEFNQGIIMVFLKKGKNPEHCGSHRLISLLNLDSKIYATILAKRLKGVLGDIISVDQSGFLPQRSGMDNVVQVMRTVYGRSMAGGEEAILLLDIEKAFDSVAWQFMWQVLLRMGCAEQFLKLVRVLYTTPTSRLRTGRVMSQVIPHYRGTRQGCPLSPLLFIMMMEPLASMLRQDPIYRGICVGGLEKRILMFAGDLLKFMRDFSGSAPVLISCSQRFGRASGLYLNIHKTEILVLAGSQYGLRAWFPVSTERDMIEYLGVKITRNPNGLYAANFWEIASAIKLKCALWKKLPLSFLARINTSR